uniref:Uncharacterized protein n=1 Tax=Plectus sambesii TaxID=2011161 RepID=A0A914WIA0_9BILA
MERTGEDHPYDSYNNRPTTATDVNRKHEYIPLAKSVNQSPQLEYLANDADNHINLTATQTIQDDDEEPYLFASSHLLIVNNDQRNCATARKCWDSISLAYRWPLIIVVLFLLLLVFAFIFAYFFTSFAVHIGDDND